MITRAQAIDAAARASAHLWPGRPPLLWWHKVQSTPEQIAMLLADRPDASPEDVFLWASQLEPTDARRAMLRRCFNDDWHACALCFRATLAALEPLIGGAGNVIAFPVVPRASGTIATGGRNDA